MMICMMKKRRMVFYFKDGSRTGSKHDPYLSGNRKTQVPWLNEINQDLQQCVESLKKICRKKGSLKKKISEAKNLSEENLR